MLGELKQRVLSANLDLLKYGLVVHTWGNASARDPESGLIVIKPSGVSYDSMRADDMVVIDADGNTVEGRYKPSTDAPTHAMLYKTYKKIGGIVHTHSSFAVSWAQACRDIPPYGTTHADHFSSAIPCSRTLTQEEIDLNYEINTGRLIIETLGSADPLSLPAVLVASHGPFCWGEDIVKAVYNAVALEEIAKMAFYTALLGRGEAADRPLLEKHFRRKHGPDSYYGQKE